MTTNAHTDADHAGSGGTSMTDPYTELVEKMKPCPEYPFTDEACPGERWTEETMREAAASCKTCGGSYMVPVLPGLRQECAGVVKGCPCYVRDPLCTPEQWLNCVCQGRGWVARPYELGLLLMAMEEAGWVVEYRWKQWRLCRDEHWTYDVGCQGLDYACRKALEAWEVQTCQYLK